MKALRRAIKALVIAAVLILAGLVGIGYLRNHPQDVPWTKLDLAQQPGLFTGRKLAALGDDFGECRALLDRAGVDYETHEKVVAGHCGYADGIELLPKGASPIRLRPAGVVTSCPVAAALVMWEWNAIQPAARRDLGSKVVALRHYGAYNCRHIDSSADEPWSEHSTANAIDIAGFMLADGREVSVRKDWNGSGAKSAFLHDVRDGACALFSTVLSPDYNAAHRNHFHLDQARRGGFGYHACR